MKLTNYARSIAPNNIQGQGNAISVPSDPRAFGADTSGLEGMGRALGIGLKLAEDNMTADVTKSMTEYQRRIDDLMYNPDHGLAYLKNENARNVTQQYVEAEKKIRDEVFATVPNYKKAQDIFNQKADELTRQGIAMTDRQQYEQGKNYSLSVMNDAIEQNQISMSHNLGNDKLIESDLRNIRAAIAANGQFMGAQWVKDKWEETAGKSVSNMLAQAKADDNQQAVDSIINKYGPMVNPAYIREYIATNNQQKKQSFMLTQAQQLAQQYRKDPEGLKKYIASMTIKEPSTGNLGARIVSQIEAHHIGDSSYMDDGGGTTCVYSPLKAAHEVDPNIPVMANTVDLMEWGKEKQILRGADYLNNVQPGDMIIINDPAQENDRDHNFVWTGHGIYNAGGASGSSYEKDFDNPQDAVAMFGNGVTVAGIVAFSQLGGAGSGPTQERSLTPAEQEQLYNQVKRNIADLDAIDKKKKEDALKALREEAAQMVQSGVYDVQSYLDLAKRYEGQGGLTYDECQRTALGYVSGGRKVAGVSGSGSRGGTAASRTAFKQEVADLIADGTTNETEMADALTRAGYTPDSYEYKTAMRMNKTMIESGVDMEALKVKAENTPGVSFSQGLPYLLNYISGEKENGRTPSFEDCWNVLEDSAQPVRLDTSNGVYQVSRAGLFKATGIYSRDEDTGVSYIEGQDSAEYISDDDIYSKTGGTPVNDD